MKRNLIGLLGAFFAICLSVSPALSKTISGTTDKVMATVITSVDQINFDQPMEVAVRFDMLNDWHIFAQNPGDIGRPTEVIWNLPKGYKVTNVRWSKPQKFSDGRITQYGYATTAYYLATIVPFKNAEKLQNLEVEVKWLACRDECVPEKLVRTLVLPVTEFNVLPTQLWKEESSLAKKSLSSVLPAAETEEHNLLILLLMAVAGGIMLNFMPCIFPILSLKAISIVNGVIHPKEMRIEALFYSAGVIFSFLIMAGILFVLRLEGEKIGWGFQLQSPWFVTVMLLIFTLIFFMLLDIVQVRNPLADKMGRLSFSDKKISAFFTGFFAVLIASPCTAPFMGIAIGYTITQPAYVYYPVFVALGAGYALPFALIGFFPRWLHRVLPKPGRWMIVLKKIFAVPVFLTCAWLAWVLYSQLALKNVEYAKSKLDWEVYDKVRVEELVAQGKPVFVDFTAKWCITCLANENFVLDSEAFAELVKKHNIHIFKADWTNEDSEITEALASYGRSSIPLYVYYNGKDSGYKILPQLLTLGYVEDVIKKGSL